MSFVPLHRARFGLGAGCWIDIEADLGEGKSLAEGVILSDSLISAEEESRVDAVSSGGIPPMCWREAGELFEKFQLREDTDYFVDVATPLPMQEAIQQSQASPAWPFEARLATAFTREPPRRWRHEGGKTVVTGQIRLRSHAGVLNLSPVFGGDLRAEVACRKLRYFEEFKCLLDELAGKAAELLLSYDSPVSLNFQTTGDLATNEAALHFLMRHVMTKPRLPTSIEEIVGQPHVRLVERVELESIEEILEADPELISEGLDHSELRAGGPLGRLFRGFTPASLPQRESYESRDTPENRYAKAFLEHCSLVARRLEGALAAQGRRASAREARSWAVSIDEALQHGMWREVGALTQIPANSQTLLRKRGYKDLLRYDLSMRMAMDLAWKEGAQLSDGLSGDIRPVNQIYEYWCFFCLRQILLSLCVEVGGGNFLTVTKDGLKVQLAKGAQSECRFEFTQAGGAKVRVSLFFNRRFRRPKTPKSAWEDSYTAFFDPDFSIRLTKGAEDAPSHWLHFDAKYRLERQQTEVLFEEAPDGEQGAAPTDYEAEVARVHKLEDLFKMHTYRDGILGTRGAYVLFPGDGVGGLVGVPKPNLFVRNPAAFGGAGSQRIPSVGAFDLAPGGDAEQTKAIASLLASALQAVAGPFVYEEERGYWTP
ncbi:hypothetical protein CH75_18700 [Dyella jiangningensis]|nr:hypothetical protein CH75_18700 [Dyella jiangningensis]